VAVTVLLPFTPLGALFSFTPPPPVFLLVMMGIVGLYILSAEVAKSLFYRAGRS
jgi:Mg2+-importing ATPase